MSEAELMPVVAVLAALAGALMGSFIDTVATRLPPRLWQQALREAAQTLGQPGPVARVPSLLRPPSYCARCETPIRWPDLIPIASWLRLRGRCRACGARIGTAVLATEISTAALTSVLVVHFGWTAPLLPALLLAWTLLALAIIDLRTQWLPDTLTLPLLWGGLLVNLHGMLAPLPDAVAGAAAGYLVLAGVNYGYRSLRQRNGIGGGDAKLLAALGAWLGWQTLPALLLLASASGILWAVTMIWRRRLQADAPFPFGPFLAGAGIVALWLQRPW